MIPICVPFSPKAATLFELVLYCPRCRASFSLWRSRIWCNCLMWFTLALNSDTRGKAEMDNRQKLSSLPPCITHTFGEVIWLRSPQHHQNSKNQPLSVGFFSPVPASSGAGYGFCANVRGSCKRAVYLSPFSARFVTAENGDLGVILALPRYSKLRIKSSLAAALLLAAPPTV